MTRLPARTVFLAASAVGDLLFEMGFAISSIYLVTVVKLNPLQLVLVGTALEATVFLFEVPTGVVADLYSRRLSVVIGTFLVGAGFVLWGLVPVFAAVLLAQVVWGIGYTFTSGADAAWITDEVGEAEASRLFLRATQLRQVAGVSGIILGTALATIRLNIPLVLGGILFFALGVFLVLYMPEHGFVPKPHANRTTRQKMSHTFTSGLALVRGRSVLVTILVIGVLFGGASEAFDRLWTIHLLKNFTFPAIGHLQPVVWFGIINVGAMLLMLAATEVVRRRLDVTNPSAIARTLLGMNVVRIATVIIFGLTQGFVLAMAMFWMTRIFVRMNTPLLTAWLNQGLDPSVRATVLSMREQADALGQIAGGPVLGALATAVSIRAALVAVGLIVAPAIWLLRKTEKS